MDSDLLRVILKDYKCYQSIFLEKFTEFDFNVAGETGIDITIKGNDKSQILTDFTKSDIIHFYGDKCDFGGNDHTIAMGVYNLGEPNSVYQVQDWRETWEQLKSV